MRLAAACFVAWASLVVGAAAERAPIVYAGQGAAHAQADHGGPVSLTVEERLAGGQESSYGYGAERQRSGSVIDIRRGERVAASPARFEETAPSPAGASSDAPVRLLGEQGAQPWLERERVGPPYEANGRWYVPTPEPGYEQTGEASWYGPDFHGHRTASGETYDQEAMTAAHPTLPLQSLLQVTNMDNGREVIVRVNDRGPFVGERLIDLSRAAADVLGFQHAGRARVHVRYLGPAPRRVNADGEAPLPATAPSPPPPSAAPEPAGPMPLWAEAPAPATESESDTPVWNAPTLQQTTYNAPRTGLAAGQYVVQVGAYSDPANAQRVRAVVSAAGPVEVDVRRTHSGAELFRVRVGPWADAAEAEAVRRRLAATGYPEAVIAQR